MKFTIRQVGAALALVGLSAPLISFAQARDTPPSTPTNLAARAYGPTSGGISWNRSSGDRGVSAYEVTVGDSLYFRGDALSFVGTDLEPGASYQFVVVAIDSAGQRSGRASVRLVTPDARPVTVTGLRASVYSATSAGLAWERASAFGTSYEIKRDGQLVATTTGTSYIDRSLSSRRPYLFEVIAVNRQGQRAASARLFVNTGSAAPTPPAAGLSAPAGLRAVAYSTTAGAIAWDRPTTFGLRYEVSRDGQVITTTDGTSYVDNTLRAGGQFKYEVVAIDRQGRRSQASRITLATGLGTDPIDGLEVRDSFALNARPEAIDAIETVSKFFEESLPEERPYFVQRETLTPFSIDPFVEGLTESVLIDIDAGGTGTYRDVSERQDADTIRRDSKIATRTSNGNSIVWSGTYTFSDSSSGIQREFEFTAEISSAGERTRLQTGEFEKESSGDASSANRTIDVSYDLTTGTIDGLNECDPLTGTIVYDSTARKEVGGATTLIDTLTTIAKQEGDRYWTVRETNLDESLRDEYLIVSVGLGPFCDFPEL